MRGGRAAAAVRRRPSQEKRESICQHLLRERPLQKMGEQTRIAQDVTPMDAEDYAPAPAAVEARSSKGSPASLPKAPQSKQVAQRLLMHSNMRPVQRFDSADYFMKLHDVAEQKKISQDGGSSTTPEHPEPPAQPEQLSSALEEPMLPPPLSSHASPRSVEDRSL